MSDIESEVEEGSSKSGRLPAMTQSEKAALTELVRNHSSVVNNKATNQMWKEKKIKAWEEIANQFNSNPEFVKRKGPQIAKAWENLKTRSKIEIATFHKTVKQTGGGSPPPPISDMASKVASTVPAMVTSIPIQNPFDSDAATFKEDAVHCIQDRVALKIAKSSSLNADKSEDTDTCALSLFLIGNSAKRGKKRRVEADTDGPGAKEEILCMEREQHAKKIYLLNLQIQSEEQKINHDKEEHEARMELIKKQILNIGNEDNYNVQIN